MSILYELGTDDVAQFATGYALTPYANHPCCKEIFQSMKKLVNYMISQSDGRFTWLDVKQFAITGDDRAVLRKLFGKEDPQNMVNFLNGKIDYGILERIFAYRAQTNQGLRSYIPLLAAEGTIAGIGGLVIFNNSQANAQDLGSIQVSPPIYGEDSSILTPEFENEESKNEKINIIGIEGEIEPGGILNVSAVITENGVVEQNPEDFRVNYTLQKVTPQSFYLTPIVSAQEFMELSESENCLENCEVILPDDLEEGKYMLVAQLHSKDTNEILDTDSEEITYDEESTTEESDQQEEQQDEAVEEEEQEDQNILDQAEETFGDIYGNLEDIFPILPDPPQDEVLPEDEQLQPEPKTVIGVTVYGQEMDLNNLDQALNLHLPGIEGQAEYFNVPIEVEDSDGSKRFFTLDFDYNPPQTPEEPSDQCPNWQFYQNECTGCNEARSVEQDSCSGETRISAYNVYDRGCAQWCEEDCLTSCGLYNGENCTNQYKADIECTDYYQDNSYCSFTDDGPRGDGCIP